MARTETANVGFGGFAMEMGSIGKVKGSLNQYTGKLEEGFSCRYIVIA